MTGFKTLEQALTCFCVRGLNKYLLKIINKSYHTVTNADDINAY